ncbi:competence protein CoiA [Kitasatospora sp. NPDC059160]|uniref:competence protein CoiA family protein n=1 Tax=Kitasatospora sp. NPDC059160 TaxID=3346748 RepID=UPI0036C05770
MAFRAVHAQWGTVFSHLPDLGCARSWEQVWKTRPPEPLTCDECSHPMHAKTSRTGLRFFAHAPGAPTCALGLESVAHHLLKLELANAARDAGAHAGLEVRGPDGTWRADVLATDPAGAWKIALEAQLAPITDAEITARTEKMSADGVTSIWFSDRLRPPWLGTVPSIRLTQPDGEQHLVVAEGLVRFVGDGWKPVRAPLTDFLAWAFSRRIVAHTPRTPLWGHRSLATVWTAPQYIAAETAHLEEEERRRRIQEAKAAVLQRAKEKRREEIRERNVVTRAKALAEATAAEQAARSRPPTRQWQVARVFRLGVKEALAKLADEHGVTATVGLSTGDPRYAGGVPFVDEYGVPVAVFDPDPARVRGEAFLLLAGLLLIFPSKAAQRRFDNATNIKKKHRPIDGYRTEILGAPEGGPGRSWGRRTCTCATPQLVATIQNAQYPAEPSEQMGSATALFHAECRACGGRYDKPWRRTGSTSLPRQQRRPVEEHRDSAM